MFWYEGGTRFKRDFEFCDPNFQLASLTNYREPCLHFRVLIDKRLWTKVIEFNWAKTESQELWPVASAEGVCRLETELRCRDAERGSSAFVSLGRGLIRWWSTIGWNMAALVGWDSAACHKKLEGQIRLPLCLYNRLACSLLPRDSRYRGICRPNLL